MGWFRRTLTFAPLLLSLDGLAATPAGDVFVDVPRAQTLIAQGATVVDARGRKDWLTAHVPGSGPLAWTDLRDGLLRTGLLTDDDGRLQAALRGAGVFDARPVIVVGAGEAGWGEEGRITWMLEYLGHPSVHLLDGGWPAWVAAGAPAQVGASTVQAGDFQPRRVAPRRVSTVELSAKVAACAGAPASCDTVVWDTREAREYQGATPYGEKRGGHIPGAVGLWYSDLTDAQGKLWPEAELRRRLAAAGIDTNKRVVALCTGGVRSGFAYAVLRHLGVADVANYDGSMWAWSADAALPMVGGG